MKVPEPYLTKEQAADHAGVHLRTIERWIKLGLLRAYGPPGLILVREDELDAIFTRERSPR